MVPPLLQRKRASAHATLRAIVGHSVLNGGSNNYASGTVNVNLRSAAVCDAASRKRPSIFFKQLDHERSGARRFEA